MNPKRPGKEIQFLDSFNADTSIVHKVITRLITDLKEMNYPQPEIDEIIISVDEAITNAIQGTIRKQEDEYEPSSKFREITIRYKISNDNFNATIIDRGGGLDILKSLQIIPNTSADDYFSQIMHYITETDKQKIRLKVNGKEFLPRGIGAGLKILLTFMDSISIDLIDQERIVANTVSKYTDGTILNIMRDRRY